MLLLALLIGTVFWLDLARIPCDIPIGYRLGVIDEQFNISREEAREAVDEAVEIWESATGVDLFQYDETAALTINFIYDERQQNAVAEESFRDQLSESEEANESFQDTYNKLLGQYNTLLDAYNIRLAAYQKAQEAYAEIVDKYNREGGAPPDVYEELEAEREELDQEADELNEDSEKLNILAKKLNSLSDKGNKLIEIYNDNVEKYNNIYSESEEFTQGDYQADVINIYSFVNNWELRTVLAHELGHALSLEHVENDRSIMYYLIGEQPLQPTLSEEDLREFNQVCVANREWWYRLVSWI